MRKWSVYERNQLSKFGFSVEGLEKYGEMPVEYITGHAEFDGLDFLVNSDVLIPRVESLQMIEVADEFLTDRKNVNFCEIGTGCGAIGIALYRRLKVEGKRTEGLLTDISSEAIKMARNNYERLVPDDTNIEFLVSDLMDSVPTEMFDLILANLPYIPTSRVPRLPESVVEYEPHLALDGGPEGLTLIKKLLQQAVGRVRDDGALILEIDYSHDVPDFVDIGEYQYEIVRDEFGQNRFLLARPRVS